jgi:competence protein ComEA
MLHFLRNISGWFGYSRRERRASSVLLVLVILVIISRFVIPVRKSSVTIQSPVILYRERPVKMVKAPGKDTAVLFSFDPNSASAGELTILGMNEHQVRTIMRYREKGGRFIRAQDINRIYGMDSSLVRKLSPFVKIAVHVREPVKTTRYDSLNRPSRSIENWIKPDLNKCDSAELERLPGIGPVLSGRIIKYRDLLGGFCSVNQLREVYGISDSTFSLISGMVIADSTCVKRIEINHAVFGDLLKHPYLERYDVQGILKYRQVKGKICNIQELVSNKILSAGKAIKIRSYLIFD